MARHKRVKRKVNNKPFMKNDSKTEALRNDKVMPVIQMLKSTKQSDRMIAITAANALVEDRTTRELLLKEDVLGVIMTNTLSDISQEIIAESLGVLRNLVLEQGPTISAELLAKNITVPLKKGLEDFNRVLPDLEKLTDSEKQVANDFGQNLLALASTLIYSSPEQSHRMLSAFGSTAVEIAMKAAQSSRFLAETSLDFIYTIAEYCDGNTEFTSWINTYKAPANAKLMEKIYFAGIKVKQLYLLGQLAPPVILEAMQAVGGFMEQLKVPEASSESTAVKSREQLLEWEIILDVVAVLVESSASSKFTAGLEFAINTFFEPLECLVGDADLCSRAFAVLNNLCWAFVSLENPWLELAEKLWPIAKNYISSTDEAVLSSVFGITAAICNEYLESIPEAELKDMISLLRNSLDQVVVASQNDSFNEDWAKSVVNLISTLNTLLAKTDLLTEADFEQLTRVVHASLAQYSTISPQVLLELVEPVFGLYGCDIPVQDNAWTSQGLAPTVELVARHLESLLQTDNIDEEFVEEAEQTVQNLEQFLVYKSNQ